MDRPNKTKGTNVLNRILACFAAVTAVELAVVIWEIFKGWRTANGLP